MAKKNPNALSVADIFWFAARNYGRDMSLFDTEPERCSKAVILRDGWLDSMPVSVVEMSENDKATAVSYLQTKWETLKSSQVETTYRPGGDKIVATPSEVLRAFEENFTRGGKVITPQYEGVFAFQRGASLLDTLVLRFKSKITGDYTVPVNVKEFGSHSERVSECVRENTSKTSGLKVVDSHWPTLFKAGLEYWNSRKAEGKSVTEADIIRLITSGATSKRGTGGKVYGIISLHLRFPELQISEKITGADGQKFGASLGQKEIRELEIGSRTKVPEGTKAVNAEGVLEYLSNPKAPSVTIPTVTPRKDAIAFADSLSNRMVKEVVKMVYDANLKGLLKFEPYAEACNALLK